MDMKERCVACLWLSAHQAFSSNPISWLSFMIESLFISAYFSPLIFWSVKCYQFSCAQVIRHAAPNWRCIGGWWACPAPSCSPSPSCCHPAPGPAGALLGPLANWWAFEERKLSINGKESIRREREREREWREEERGSGLLQALIWLYVFSWNENDTDVANDHLISSGWHQSKQVHKALVNSTPLQVLLQLSFVAIGYMSTGRSNF